MSRTVMLHNLEARKWNENHEIPSAELDSFLEGFRWYECATLEPGSPTISHKLPDARRGRRFNPNWTVRKQDEKME